MLIQHVCPRWGLTFTPRTETTTLLVVGWFQESCWCRTCLTRPCLPPLRFLLHLAEKTDGIIVTNDNLRDFVDASDTWRRIIQER